MKLVARKGHEIALHGYEHENFGLLSAEEQRTAIKKGINSLISLTGEGPAGFRLPEGNMTPDTLSIVAEQGFLYDSSMVDSDVPYRIIGLTQGRSLIEIPMCWELQDFTYFAFNFVPPFPEGESRIASYQSVLDIWLRELQAYYEYGLCYVIKFDPRPPAGLAGSRCSNGFWTRLKKGISGLPQARKSLVCIHINSYNRYSYKVLDSLLTAC